MHVEWDACKIPLACVLFYMKYTIKLHVTKAELVGESPRLRGKMKCRNREGGREMSNSFLCGPETTYGTCNYFGVCELAGVCSQQVVVRYMEAENRFLHVFLNIY